MSGEAEAIEESEKPAENKMGIMPTGRLLFTMALPMMISMLIQALYNVVDSIFVSRLSEDALTAVSMAFPMQNLLIGVGTGMCVGMNALLSRRLGEKKQKEANEVAMHGLFLAFLSFLTFLVLGLTVSRIFFVVQGANESITGLGHEYLSIVMCCSIGIYTELVFERLLQSTGRTIYTMFTQGLGAITNIILDPVFIFGLFGFPAMGIRGAATATVAGQILAAILAMSFHFRLNKEIQLSFKGFRPRLKIIGNILYIGIPSIIMVAIGSVMSFGVNRIIVVFSSTAVAVFGVYYKLQSFAFMPVFGLNNGMVPIIAYNYGARKPDRIVSTVKWGVLFAECIMFVAFSVMEFGTSTLLSFFNASDEMMAIGLPALRIICLSFLLAGFNVIATSFFQAMGNAVYSMIGSLLRQLIILLPLVYVFSLTLNIDLIWWAWPIAELASTVCTIFFTIRINKNLLQPLRREPASSGTQPSQAADNDR